MKVFLSVLQNHDYFNFQNKNLCTNSISENNVVLFLDSVEPCCGTHVLNTSDVQSFVILSMKSPHPGHKLLTCATGQRAAAARNQGLELIDEVMEFNNEMDGINLKDNKEVYFTDPFTSAL